MVRLDQADVVYKTETAKWDAVVGDIVDRHENGQPVLVGTVSVEKSEHLSGMLLRRGIPHEVLNAKYHEKEALIVAQAGRRGSVTVATNMAGRGTDIMLGGNPEFLATEELRNRGLSPVENGEDYERAWPDSLNRWQSSVKAEHEEVVGAGGLYVLATERHESRRIDNQLRGRSGRQGDPGESRFYLSLGDDLMRLFNSAAVERIMDTLNIPEEIPIESKIVTRAIRSAQTQVEQQNFEIRKNVLKYDEVLNKQRTVIYDERRKVLQGADLHEQVRNMIDDVVEAYATAATAEGYPEEWDLDQLWTALKTLYPVGITVDDVIREAGSDEGDRSGLTSEFLISQLQDDAQAAYDKREQGLGDEVARELERRVVLSVLDRKWREHLYEMDYLQEGIGLRSFGQRDPLVEYQREGFTMFAAMLEGIKEESVGFLFNVEVQVDEPGQEQATAQPEPQPIEQWAAPAPEPALAPTPPPPPLAAPVFPAAAEQPAQPAQPAPAAQPAAAAEPHHPHVVAPGLGPQRPQQLQYTAPSVDGEAGAMHTAGDGHDHSGPPGVDAGPVVHPGQTVGSGPPRNQPCPCGSGKKYKRCHGDPRNRTAAAS
jgi:preprotein translocase subunit SecA